MSYPLELGLTILVWMSIFACVVSVLAKIVLMASED